MLDLSKSYGRYEGVTFFGDHQDETIIYYLPDEIKLSPRPDREDEYEFFLQLFHENKMVDASSSDMEDSAGSILQLSIDCMVAPERLQQAFDALRRTITSIPGNARLTTPVWTDGRVDLITLDKSSFDNQSSDMVKAIVTSQRPSLTQNLKSVFNVRYDRRGTELINSAIGNGQGVIAADYDLQFAAIRPAADIKITAFLSRCQETALENIDANLKFTYQQFQADLGAHFEWLTQKMVENGSIKIEVTSMVTDEEEQKRIDRLVDEFKDSVIRELFKPSVLNDEDSSLLDSITDRLIKISDVVTPIKVGFCYKLSNEKISEDRILSVDYSERSAIIQHHNPKALLMENSDLIADHYDDYVKKVAFGELWDTQSVDIELFHDFDDPNNDLESVEVIVWKHKDGVLESVPENHFAKPDKAKPLGDFDFSVNESEKKHHISWLCDEDDDGGYYYQIRLIYSSNVDNHCSPKEIVTQPVLSSSRILTIAPNAYMFFREVPIMAGSVDFSVFEKVEVIVDVEDCNGEPIAKSKRFVIDEKTDQRTYAVRGKDKSELNLWVSKVFYFKKKSQPPLKFPRFLLKDYAVMVDDPLIEKEIIPIILGDTEDVKKIIVGFSVHSEVVDRDVSTTKMFTDFEDEEPISIIIYTPDDLISYEITKVYRDSEGKIRKQVLGVEKNIPASELDDLFIDLDAVPDAAP